MSVGSRIGQGVASMSGCLGFMAVSPLTTFVVLGKVLNHSGPIFSKIIGALRIYSSGD